MENHWRCRSQQADLYYDSFTFEDPIVAQYGQDCPMTESDQNYGTKPRVVPEADQKS